MGTSTIAHTYTTSCWRVTHITWTSSTTIGSLFGKLIVKNFGTAHLFNPSASASEDAYDEISERMMNAIVSLQEDGLVHVAQRVLYAEECLSPTYSCITLVGLHLTTV